MQEKLTSQTLFELPTELFFMNFIEFIYFIQLKLNKKIANWFTKKNIHEIKILNKQKKTFSFVKDLLTKHKATNK